MDFLRVVLAIATFSTSVYLVVDLFINGFNLAVLLFCIAGFVLAHYIWPKNYREENEFLDWVEFVIDFPFKIISQALRVIGRGAKEDSDFDFD